MFNLSRSLQLIPKPSLIRCRHISISKSDLIESSRNIQQLLHATENESSFSTSLYSSLSQIHAEYPSTRLATSTKDIYQSTSSQFNAAFSQLENDRTNQTGGFQANTDEQLFILLRYLRYLQVAFSYRFITFDVNHALRETSDSVLDLAKDQDHFRRRFVDKCTRLARSSEQTHGSFESTSLLLVHYRWSVS